MNKFDAREINDELVELRRRVEELERRPAGMQVHHHHYHYSYPQTYQLPYYQWYPKVTYYGASGITNTSGGFSTTNQINSGPTTGGTADGTGSA